MTDDRGGDVTLRDVLESAAEGLPGVTIGGPGPGTEWAVGRTAFACLEGLRGAFRLDPLVGRAALGTPDTGASPRGADWVAFAPEVLDETAVDRAEAWFLSAYRRAAKAR